MCVGDTELRPTAGSCVRLCKRHLQYHAGPGKPKLGQTHYMFQIYNHRCLYILYNVL